LRGGDLEDGQKRGKSSGEHGTNDSLARRRTRGRRCKRRVKGCGRNARCGTLADARCGTLADARCGALAAERSLTLAAERSLTLAAERSLTLAAERSLTLAAERSPLNP
jgi:hypothetical protein